MEVFLLIIRLFLAAIFLAAGIAKLADRKGSKKAMRDFGAPQGLAAPLAVLLPLAEISLAALLLPSATAWFGAIGVFALLAVFIGGMLWQMSKGNAPDCHCFGQLHSEPVSVKSVIRNALFALLALFLIAAGRENQGLSAVAWIGDVTVGERILLFFGSVITGLLVAALLYLRQVLAKQNQLARQIEIMQVLGHEHGGEVEREGLTSPEGGLPVGAPAPKFELPDLSGEKVRLEHLLKRGKAMLFLFVSPTCAPCEALLPEIAAWKTEFSGKLDLIFISLGSAKDNEEKFAAIADKTILLQQKMETAALFEAKWTPSAVLVNSDGVIASRVAAGDAAIRELIKKIKASETDPVKFIDNGKGQSPKPPKFDEPAPEFELPTATGGEIRKQELLGKKTLALFWGLNCPHCQAMLPEIQNWERETSNGAQKAKSNGSSDGIGGTGLLVFSDGSAEDNLALKLNSPVLLDKGGKIAEQLGLYGTPSAVLINEHGRIASETAIGAAQIRALLGKRVN
jgi:thiol-disulfide isomerase/thioredoxin/uncharacterized membrane protein YphA (DoxX/SURF4 family)